MCLSPVVVGVCGRCMVSRGRRIKVACGVVVVRDCCRWCVVGRSMFAARAVQNIFLFLAVSLFLRSAVSAAVWCSLIFVHLLC